MSENDSVTGVMSNQPKDGTGQKFTEIALLASPPDNF